MKLRIRIVRHPTNYERAGRQSYQLYIGGVEVAGIIRYRWKCDWIGYMVEANGDRDVARGPKLGPVKQATKRAMRQWKPGQSSAQRRARPGR